MYTRLGKIRQSGVTLVEVVVFMVVMAVGVVGLLNLMNNTVRSSSDPMLQKQALAIAESLMEEILLQPFTNCDPAAFNIASSTCSQAEGPGPETVGTTQTRYSTTHPFNNVNDYHGFAMTNGIFAISDGTTVIAGLERYSAAVTVTDAGTDFSLPADDAIRIDVQVTNPAGEQIRLSGYRFKYALLP